MSYETFGETRCKSHWWKHVSARPRRGKPTYISTPYSLLGGLIDREALDGEHGVKSAFNIKMSKYDERCTAEGITFIPLAVDSFGGWHGAALDVFSKLARQLFRQLGKEEEEVTRQLMQRLSIILARDNVGVMGSRIPALPPATVDHDINL